MELRLLRYFVAVAEELHFGRAAERLFIAQPSLSTQIRVLERELGTRLFDRDRHRVELTESGHALLEPARQVLAASDGLLDVVRVAVRRAGRLRVGYVPYARSPVLADVLDAVRRARPDAEITVRSGNDSPEVIADLRDGRIDVGVFRAPASAPWMLQTTLTVEPFHVALPPGHPRAAQDEVRLPELRTERFALFAREQNPAAHDHLMRFFAAAGFAPVVAQASRRMDESMFFVASGGGVGLFPLSVAAAVTDPRIVFRPLVDPVPTVEIVLGWDRGNPNPLVPELVHAARRRAGAAVRRDHGRR